MNRIRYLILLMIGVMTPFLQTAAQHDETDAFLQTAAQHDETDADVPSLDSLADFLPENLDFDRLRLLEKWHATHFSDPDEHCIDDDVNPYFSDTIYRKRLNRIMTMIPMTYNETVRKYIDFYAIRGRKSLRYLLGMSDYYFPMIEQILDANDLPLELKYVTIVESALNPVALSRAGASGLWQFMLPTGKSNGLEINSLIDERLDPEKATEAACRHFKTLYNMYDDWHLALAAYNCGAGNVNKAILRSGGKMDFWKIYPHLPRETRIYVPLFIAATYIMTYHCDHNICPVRANFAIATDTLMVERALHFDQIAEILQIDKEIVRFYNPQYKREIIPGHIRPSILRLPIENTFAFIDQGDSVYRHRIEELLENCAPIDGNDSNNRRERIMHSVKAGETINTIAHKYGVTTQDLRKWNGLSGSRVASGKRLIVYIDNGGLAYSTSKSSSDATATTQKKQNTGSASSNTSGYISYTVQSGDSLYIIAKKYPGVTVQSIQQANGLTTTNLRIGQVLKIPQG